jgi:hypothetical protein
MTATWVLIVFLHYGQAGVSADFYSKDKCEAAGKIITNDWGKVTYYCVEK